MSNQKIGTRVIHGGQDVDTITGAVMPSISTSSTYAQESPGKHTGFEYSRSHNPTRFAYEKCVANIESGHHGYAFASGLAAISTVLELLNSGDHVLACDDVYGGTYRLFENVRRRSAGLDFTMMDFSDLKAVESAIKPTTKMIWIETPTNPMLKVIDLAGVVKIAKKNHLITVVDNTFASPILQRPLELGVDIVLHSATKYLGGHSDVVSGCVVVGENKEIAEKLTYLQNAVGAIAGPFDSYLVLRGMKTLAIRMKQHCENAQTLAEWLEKHPKVGKVIYPGLKSHPNHALATHQMSLYGGMISLAMKLNSKETCQFLERCEIFTIAESLGGVESLISMPALMTHASIPKEKREALGITDGFVRISVGIEDVEDLRADLEKALGRR